MLGYHKVDPEEYLDRNGYFRTGDSGHLDETGILHWGGRLTGMIKTAGANVSPEEISSKLLWGRLKACDVVPVPHPLLGEAVVLCAIRATRTTRSHRRRDPRAPQDRPRVVQGPRSV